jgi:hypothetical protein
MLLHQLQKSDFRKVLSMFFYLKGLKLPTCDSSGPLGPSISPASSPASTPDRENGTEAGNGCSYKNTFYKYHNCQCTICRTCHTQWRYATPPRMYSKSTYMCFTRGAIFSPHMLYPRPKALDAVRRELKLSLDGFSNLRKHGASLFPGFALERLSTHAPPFVLVDHDYMSKKGRGQGAPSPTQVAVFRNCNLAGKRKTMT